ncbi:MAG: hemerythrin domain-containing protein [Betaproteobacteria bacterium]
MEFKVPPSLKQEHEELHAELVAATKAGGKISEAAQAVARALHPHFVKEEEYALPLLGLLTMLAEGKLPADSRTAITMTDRLKEDFGHMLHEHKAIVIELHKLMEAAQSDKKPEYVHLAEKLKLHAQTEEEVLYPAAILVGEYLKLKQP